MLTTQQRTDIETLQQVCEAHDQIQLKLNWDMLKQRGTDRLDFFHYEQEELVAFLGLYPFGSTVEVCGMVKPSERRQGHFSRLIQQGMAQVKQNGYKQILLNTPAASSAAHALLRNIGAEYAFSEHQMTWQQTPLQAADGVLLRQAAAEDHELLVRLSIEGFGLDEADARAMESSRPSDLQEQLMIDVQGETVGRIRVSRENGQAWIYGFVILPEHQGKGIGRQALSRVVQAQNAEGFSVHLEVETKNGQALGLYESVGFKAVHVQDYYRYSLG